VSDIDGEGVQKDVGSSGRLPAALILNAEQVVFIGYSLPNYDQFARELFQLACRDKREFWCASQPDVIKTFRANFSRRRDRADS